MLGVGAESIGLQTEGKTVKFRIIPRRPGEKIADFSDPCGQKGFSSMLWWYAR